MRRIICVLWSLLYFSAMQAGSVGSGTVNQEIKYYCPDATEVFLVWGVNDWKQPDKSLWPEGTYQKNNALSTPMKAEDGFFTVKMKVSPGTKIDYCFWITQGPRGIPSDIWDVNKKPLEDYHTLAANDNITIIQSKIEVKSKSAISLLDYAGTILIFTFALAILFFISRKYFFSDIQFSAGAVKIIIACSAVLMIFLLILRISVQPYKWDVYYHPFKFLPKILYAGFYDYLYVIILTFIFIGLVYLFKKKKRVVRTATAVFCLFSLISLVAGMLNIRVVEQLGRPFNYRWFYYSGFLKSEDSQAAMTANVSSSYVWNIIFLCLAAGIGVYLLLRFTDVFIQKFRLKKVLLILLLVVNGSYLIYSGTRVSIEKDDYDRLANPVAEFLSSVNPFEGDPELYSIEVADSLVYDKSVDSNNQTLHSKYNKIKNVVLVVLESTAAEYVQPYDKTYKATPYLAAYLPYAMVFENVYAHAPATNKSMVSLMASVYPWLSYNNLTYEHPTVSLPTISSELHNKGYRTAFFNSGDNKFLKAGEFLAERKLDEILDKKNLTCKVNFEEVDDKFDPLDGIDDECGGDALADWIVKDTSKPFFAALWTFQTHYPYYYSGDQKNYAADPFLNRYLNAVNHSDYVLGKILKRLEDSGLMESTLVVVIGDHGEAFGRHDQTTHASKIYEENTHIPCILINPAFTDEHHSTIGGISDIAPTILNFLGYNSAPEWQGQSLLAEKRKGRTYFYCPWSDYLYGFREGNRKYIFNATRNTTEVYDLVNDPFEQSPLNVSDEELEIAHQKLAAWVQYQDKYMKQVIAKNTN